MIRSLQTMQNHSEKVRGCQYHFRVYVPGKPWAQRRYRQAEAALRYAGRLRRDFPGVRVEVQESSLLVDDTRAVVLDRLAARFKEVEDLSPGDL